MKKRKLTVSLFLAVYLLTSGCAAFLVGAGVGTAGVIWYKGKLQETVSFSVPHVHRAAVAGLKDLNIRITEERYDSLTSEIRGELADGKQIWVDAVSKGPSMTELTIRVGVLGDKPFSLRIRDAIRNHL